MKKTILSTAALVAALGFSGAAMAWSAHYFKVYGEGYGHTAEEAVDTAARYAVEACYRTWGQSGQEITILDQYVNPQTGYWHAEVSLDCTVYD